MYLPKVYDPNARAYRIRYAIANIMRDRVANEGAFHSCFEMGDEDDVICAILRRGQKNTKLRAALMKSNLVCLHRWLADHPELAGVYYGNEK
jgi:cystathionine beta-lyase/cystathionine gamma-synthase